MATTKRGAHLMLSLERLEAITSRPPQRIGLSATQRPLEEVAHFLGGHADAGAPRPVTIVDAGIRKPLEIEVVVPVEDMGDLGTQRPTAGSARSGSIWPSIYPRILAAGARPPHHDHLLQRPPPGRAPGRQAQRAGAGRGHRGRRPASWSRPTTGRWPASSGSSSRTSSSAGSCAAIVATQLAGAGHRHGRGRPGHPGRVARRGVAWAAAHRPRRPLGRRAEQGHDLPEAPRRPARGGGRHPADGRRADRVAPASCATRSTCSPSRSSPTWPCTPTCRSATLAALVRRCAVLRRAQRRAARQRARPARRALPERGVQRAAPADRVGPGRPARCAPATGRSGWRSPAAARSPTAGCSACSCPTAPRVGELDEEMVYESRPGETFLLGASTWRIEDITFERVTVTPGAGRAGQDAVLARRPAGPPARARSGARRVPARDPRAADGRGARPADGAPLARRVRRQQRAAVPRRAGRGHRRGARRPHRRGRAVPRRDRRLAGVHPHARSARRCTPRGRWPSSGG